MAVKKYLDLVGLGEYHGQLKTKWFDKLDAVVTVDTQDGNKSKIINTTVLSGTPTASGAGNTLANTDVVASTKWVLNEISGITEPMIFKGSVSISGTTLTFDDGIEEIKTGYTFKFTEAAGDFKAGDVIIAKTAVTVDTTGTHPTATYDADEWTVVPAGDDVDVTGVTAGTGLSASLPSGQTGSTITTTGTINLEPATASTIGGVKDGDRVTIAADGTISADLASVTNSTAGAVLPDGTVITLNASTGAITVPNATSSAVGVVKVDDTTIKVDGNGTINAEKAGAVASSAAEGTVSANLGTVKGSVDNGVLVDSNGVLGIATISSTEITNIVTPSSGT